MIEVRHRMRRATCVIGLVVTLLLGIASEPPAFAGEGGGSHYFPGIPGDFAMALIGPAGFYVRNDLIYFNGDIGPVTLGNRILSSASQDLWVNTTKFIYLADRGIFGGRFGAVVTVPLVLNAKVSGQVDSPFQGESSGSRSGFADITVTSFLNWSFGYSHASAGLSVYMPAGAYSPDRIINLGRNYWSFDPIVSYTWLHPTRGHELSFTTGFMFNTKNDATDYSSGTEWHMDFMLAQHFSKMVAVGLEGSVLRGITDDSGALLDRANATLSALGLQSLGGFRAEFLGLGPALLLSPTIGNTTVNFVVKYLVRVLNENRFDGNYVMASVALKF